MVATHRLAVNQIYKAFDEPCVYFFKAAFEGEEIMRRLGKLVKPGDWCFESLMWYYNWSMVGARYRRRKFFKSIGVNYVVMANSPLEVWKCRATGVPARLMPQGQFINEQLFPLGHPNRKLKYDAFYAAQANPFKRMYLAEYVKNLYILTYLCPTNASGDYDLSLFEPKIAHAEWNKRYIARLDKIIRLIHQSRCALALSKVEGAMWASLEAMLCGLPVISTRSKGGRSRYFTPENSRIVRADPTAVARAVEYYKQHPPNPEKVRKSVLERIEADRERTITFFLSNVLASGRWNRAAVDHHLFRKRPDRLDPMGGANHEQ